METALTSEQESAFVAGLQQQQRRLQQLLTQVVEPEVWYYLDEGARCFGIGAYNAAIVMGWCAVTCYYRLVARLNFDLFTYCFQTQHDKTIEDPKRIKDWELIQACERMKMLLDVQGKLDSLQAKRNDCAHPDRVPINPADQIGAGPGARPSEVVTLFEQAVELVLSRRVNSERLYGEEGAGVALEFLRSQEKGLEQAQITRLLDLLDPGQYRFLAHRLRWALQSGESDQPLPRALLQAWESIGARLDEQGRNEQLDRLAQEMQRRLGVEDYRGTLELSQLVWWTPSDPTNPIRETLCRSLVEALENVVESETADISVLPLRKLKEHAPPAYLERIEAIRARLF